MTSPTSGTIRLAHKSFKRREQHAVAGGEPGCMGEVVLLLLRRRGGAMAAGYANGTVTFKEGTTTLASNLA